jgi:hypothetical protein
MEGPGPGYPSTVVCHFRYTRVSWLLQNSESASRDAVSFGSALLDHVGTLLECVSMLGVDKKMSDTNMSVGILDHERCVQAGNPTHQSQQPPDISKGDNLIDSSTNPTSSTQIINFNTPKQCVAQVVTPLTTPTTRLLRRSLRSLVGLRSTMMISTATSWTSTVRRI